MYQNFGINDTITLGLTMAKHKKYKKDKKKVLKYREPVVLQFEPTIPIEIINAAVAKALAKYKRG